MGKLNILKAGYEGKVAETYGVYKKGGYIVKANPFSHTPHNNKQTKAKNAFVGLNRIASAVVKKFWNYLDLSDKNMYRNNALCQKWKNALNNGNFDLSNLVRVISANDPLIITENSFDPNGFTFFYDVSENNPSVETEKQYIYCGLVTNNNITKIDKVAKGNFLALRSMFDFVDFAYFRVWAFKAVPNGKKWTLEGFAITNVIYVIIVNEIFYVMRWHWLWTPYIENEVLYLPETPSVIENGILYLY